MKRPIISNRALRHLVLTSLPALLWLGAWQVAVDGNQRLEFLFASPHRIAQIAWAEWRGTEIWYHSWVTFVEAALGLLAGTVLGTLVGLLLWGNGRIDRITRPYLIVLGSLPIIALAPITIMWFGIGLLSKVVMAGFGVFFVSMMQAYEGASVIGRAYLGFANSIAAPTHRIIRRVVLPGAFSWVIAGYKMNVGAALMGAFVGEFVSSEAGLGHYILKASSLYDMPRVLFGVLMLSLLALLMTGLTKLTGLDRLPNR